MADSGFPCLGAKAAFNTSAYNVRVYEKLASVGCSKRLAQDLKKFQDSELRKSSEYATFIAIFRHPQQVTETQFERLLWSQLQQLHRIDAKLHPWDASVASDPDDPHFSFSFAGAAFYVIGLHANSSRLARRFPWPTLVFNPHEQFERLRHEGKWQRMQKSIRQRDAALQGSINPMLSDFGERSEARQYSGRVVEENWRAPFQAIAAPAKTSRCPFAH